MADRSMATQRHLAALMFGIGALVLWFGLSARAQGDTFKARLTPVPVENSTVAAITGSGSVTAVLSGPNLSVNGKFEGIRTPATLAQVHFGPKGVRGPALFDLTITKATSGTINGTLMLKPAQVDDLKAGRFYLQIHSEKAPDGNLWGWLLP